METFGIDSWIASKIPNTFNGLFSWETYEKWSDPVTGNIPIIGENPQRFTTNSNWHKRIDYQQQHTMRYRLMDAICENDLKQVKNCLDAGIDINSELCHERNINAVGLAAMLDRQVILKYLILRGANLESRDKKGNTPLMQAVINWQFESIRILVDSGAEVRAVDKNGKSAMEKAQDRNLVSIASYLFGVVRQQDEASEGSSGGPKRLSYPKFGVRFKFEGLFDGKEVLGDEVLSFGKGAYYPFNKIDGTYLIDLVDVKKALDG